MIYVLIFAMGFCVGNIFALVRVWCAVDLPRRADEKRVRDEAELAVTAMSDLVPIEGSWIAGYRVSPHGATMNELRATPQEWVDAAYHVACLHAALQGLPEPSPILEPVESREQK